MGSSTFLFKTAMIMKLILIYIWLFFVVVESQNCKLTTTDVEGPFYEQGAPTTNQIVPSNELGNPSTELLITGQILNRRCNPVSNAKVDLWYAGGNPVGYTFPPDYLWYRGSATADKNGRYSFIATYPGVYRGRPIPHIHYKVFDGRKELTTQLYFQNDVPKSFEDYVIGKQSQFPQKVKATPTGRN